MSTHPETHYTEPEYLARERRAEHRSEFFRGEAFAMAGASRRHNLIVGNCVGELRELLRRRTCEVYPSDMRVKVSSTGLYTYPDVTVACGEPRFEDEELDTLLDPTVLIEVLSDSTEAYDRGKKSEHYRKIAALREYCLIAQDRPHVDIYSRRDDSWLLTEVVGLDAAMQFASIDCTIPLAGIYEKVALDESTLG